MREKHAEACEQRSLDSLLGFASQREQIYQQTVPYVESFIPSQRQKQQLLNIAGMARSNAIASQSVHNAFTAGNPIAHNYSQNIVLHTLNYEHQRRSLQYDPLKPRMMQLEQRWKEVE